MNKSSPQRIRNYSKIITSSNRNIVLFSIATIIALTYLNMLYDMLLYSFWGTFGGFLPGPEDRFADIIKVSLSFKAISSAIQHSISVLEWPTIYKNYLFNNPYGGASALPLGYLTHFHLPPLSLLYFLACGMLLSTTFNPTYIIILNFILYIILFCVVIFYAVGYKKTNSNIVIFIFFTALLSYPALFIFCRGNYTAGVTSVLIIIFLLHSFIYKKISIISLLCLALAINIRPNAAIFLFAIPVLHDPKESIKKVFLASLMIGLIFFVALAASSHIYPDYTFSNFIKGLSIYKYFYLTRGLGDAHNSSAWMLVKSFFWAAGLPINIRIIGAIYTALSSTVFIIVLYTILITEDKTIISPFLLTALYILLCPVVADYHLLVFISPICLLLVGDNTKRDTNISTSILTVSTILLSPKSYFIYNSIVFQSLINPLILIASILYILCITPKPAKQMAFKHISY